jgi:hypothetical protein
MTTLRKAVHEYLALRRRLGFKLHKAGKALPAFVTFMEQQRVSVITAQLALTWAQQADDRSTGGVGVSTEYGPWVCTASQCD